MEKENCKYIDLKLSPDCQQYDKTNCKLRQVQSKMWEINHMASIPLQVMYARSVGVYKNYSIFNTILEKMSST